VHIVSCRIHTDENVTELSIQATQKPVSIAECQYCLDAIAVMAMLLTCASLRADCIILVSLWLLGYENPLYLSWHDSAWIPILNQHNVMDYFSERSNPFYDRQCNNEVIKMQRLNPEQIRWVVLCSYWLFIMLFLDKWEMTHFAVFIVFHGYQSVAIKFGTVSWYLWILNLCKISCLVVAT